MNDQEPKKAGLRVLDAVASTDPTRPSKIILVALCALPMLAMLLYGGVDTVMLGAFSVITTLIVVLWIMDAWSQGELRFSTNPLQLPIVGLVVLGIVQLVPLGDPGSAVDALGVAPSRALTLDPFATRMFTVRLFAYFIFFAAALTFINTERRVRKVVLSILIFSSVLAFAGILQKIASPGAMYGYRQPSDAIPFGPLINQHHFAAFMELTSGLALGLLFGGGVKRDHKPFLMIAAVLMGMAIVFTGSRGGLLSYAGVVGFALAASYLLRRRSNGDLEASAPSRFVMLAGTFALVLLIAGSVFYLGGGDSMLRGLGIGFGDSDFSTGRIQFWGIALNIFAAHPVLGSGLDTFAVAFTQYDTHSGLFRVEHAHNDYLQSLSDGGLLGFACVLAFIALLFKNGIKSVSTSRDVVGRSVMTGALAGCFGMAVHSFFDFPLRTPSNALFFLLVAVLATTPVYTGGGERSKRRHTEAY